ncbi:MAG: HAD-IIA family hydrolase [Promethearchaeota archaeon]|nr:MAG: HAD-IIA family hydrolase [Candidatus Lokiarchaeota archaeon]
MKVLMDELKNIKLAIFDLDGVIYRGKKLILNSDKVIEELKKHAIKVVYYSNNSTITREMYVKRLQNFNIPSKISDFYTSASITSVEISKIKKESIIFVIGETGLREELKAMGHTIVTNASDYKDVDFVIVGLDRDFKYQNLAIAQKCILEGKAQFYATNTDVTLPADSGLLPGAGVMVNAVETCTAKKPLKIFGKPYPYGIEMILKDTNTTPNEVCIFGDRLNTDILAGNCAGIITAVVLTGVSTRKEIVDLINQSQKINSLDKDLIPDLVLDSLNNIFK